MQSKEIKKIWTGPKVLRFLTINVLGNCLKVNKFVLIIRSSLFQASILSYFYKPNEFRKNSEFNTFL